MPTGRRFVGHSLRNGYMRFFKGNECTQVTAMGTTLHRNVQLVAYSEKISSGVPTVTIAKLAKNRVRTLEHTHLTGANLYKIKQIVFSPPTVPVSVIMVVLHHAGREQRGQSALVL